MLDFAQLAAVPQPSLQRSDAVARAVAHSVSYLGSDAALESLALDPYWPKWHSPWWHAVLLFELGEARLVPPRVVTALTKGVDGLLHLFPITAEEQAGVNLSQDVVCHCALGSMAQVLAACGVDVDLALPWVSPWFRRYQLADGGLTCDDTAYLVEGECPSSMVGTVPPLEAMLHGALPGTERRAFVDRAAGFLLQRKLTLGSPTVHNAAERVSAEAWPRLTFPRFYFYDVLRGLWALCRWAELTGQPVPLAVVAPVLEALLQRFPDGVVRVERHAFARKLTLIPTADRSAGPRVAASSFPLLEAASALGQPSEALTREWSQVRAAVLRLEAAGALTR